MDDLITALELLRERHRFGGYIHVKLVPGARGRADRAAHRAREPGVAQPRGALRRQSRAHRPGEELSRPRSTRFEQVRGHSCCRSGRARPHGKPADPLHPGRYVGHDHAVRRRRHPDTDRTHPRHGGRAVAPEAAFTTRTSARSGRSATRRWRTPPPRRRSASIGCTRPTTSCGSYGFGRTRSSTRPTGNLPLALDPKSAWALAHPERFPVEITHRIARASCSASRASARRRSADRRRAGRDDAFAASPISRKLGVVTTRAAGFLTLGGRRLQTVALDPSSSASGLPRKRWAYLTWSMR